MIHARGINTARPPGKKETGRKRKKTRGREKLNWLSARQRTPYSVFVCKTSRRSTTTRTPPRVLAADARTKEAIGHVGILVGEDSHAYGSRRSTHPTGLSPGDVRNPAGARANHVYSGTYTHSDREEPSLSFLLWSRVRASLNALVI